jgi:hypothetical protein
VAEGLDEDLSWLYPPEMVGRVSWDVPLEKV